MRINYILVGFFDNARKNITNGSTLKIIGGFCNVVCKIWERQKYIHFISILSYANNFLSKCLIIFIRIKSYFASSEFLKTTLGIKNLYLKIILIFFSGIMNQRIFFHFRKFCILHYDFWIMILWFFGIGMCGIISLTRSIENFKDQTGRFLHERSDQPQLTETCGRPKLDKVK